MGTARGIPGVLLALPADDDWAKRLQWGTKQRWVSQHSLPICSNALICTLPVHSTQLPICSLTRSPRAVTISLAGSPSPPFPRHKLSPSDKDPLPSHKKKHGQHITRCPVAPQKSLSEDMSTRRGGGPKAPGNAIPAAAGGPMVGGGSNIAAIRGRLVAVDLLPPPPGT